MIACPDNQFIPRVPDAGKLEGGQVVMHNGIKVGGMGYYGAGILNMLIENRGVHEPQEEARSPPCCRTFLEAARCSSWGVLGVLFLVVFKVGSRRAAFWSSR